ncbi:MAG: carboxypeptidase regulatory-like domain-containing protein [Planctomycetes bacterium]|nr:carboxypeptidase regulatory-like domain-containing protein [Planctomycetota bacterium]MBI3843508.1 carboxypeptidase regulatory-like domain-containing protein [Planctomycetota bacterium]
MYPAMLALLSVWFANDPPARPNLVGAVFAAGGAPIAGAGVFIYTARPRRGSSPCCPSCWPDCQKHVLTDADGRFRVPSLDPALIFRVLVVANGHEPALVSDVDPRSRALAVSLAPRGDDDLPPGLAVRGRVLDSRGRPVIGAEVVPIGVSSEFGMRYGANLGVDPLAITNARGEFVIRCDVVGCGVSVNVSARNLAPRDFEKLEAGPKRHDLVLLDGAIVTGRVLREGKPVAGVRVGLVQADRDAERFLGNDDVGTDDDGHFAFLNVPPGDRFVVYGTMGSLRQMGSVGIATIDVEADRAEVSVGDLEVEPAHRLSGRLVLADGEAAPPHTRVSISRDAAWDSQEVEIDRDGSFAFDGLPSEVFTLCASVPGYRVSPDNESFDRVNPFWLIGRIDDDVADLQFLLERGEALDSSSNGPIEASPSQQPLRGAPATSKK